MPGHGRSARDVHCGCGKIAAMPRPPSSWPLTTLRLTSGELTLRPVTEGDLDLLAELLPDDVELDPDAPRPFGLTGRDERAVVLRQEYWRHRGAWTPSAWRLPMLVFRGDLPVGMQELEGVADFQADRTVDSSSWLIESARGRGIGKAMRGAVLTLAFEGLGAAAAVSEAWHDNAASLGVSRSLGYVDTGERSHPRGAGTDRMVGLQLDREAWLARSRPEVVIDGLEACRYLFGPALT
jgi:RimJ/RimL family protein N-acetyltransferase